MGLLDRYGRMLFVAGAATALGAIVWFFSLWTALGGF